MLVGVDEHESARRVAANAFAVETKVKGARSPRRRARPRRGSLAISSAAVHDGVRNARLQPIRSSSHSEQRLLNSPAPERWPIAIASRIYPNSLPVVCGRFNGIIPSMDAIVPRPSEYSLTVCG